MPNGFFKVPVAKNEPILSYAPGSRERAELKKQLEEFRSMEVDIPMYIGGEETRTGKKVAIHPPHDINHTLGYYHQVMRPMYTKPLMLHLKPAKSGQRCHGKAVLPFS